MQRPVFFAALPDFSPSRAPASDPSATPPEASGYLTIAPSDGAIDPAERSSKLYARFLEAEAIPAPGGLIRPRCEPGTPYGLEEFYLPPTAGPSPAVLEIGARRRGARSFFKLLGEAPVQGKRKPGALRKGTSIK